MNKYKSKREIEENNEESILLIEDDEINKNKIMDFINKDGEYYNREADEEYIKEKYHINYKNNNMFQTIDDEDEINSEDDFNNISDDYLENNYNDDSDEFTGYNYSDESDEDEYTCYD